MKTGDKVTITSPLVHRIYGVKPTDEFEVKDVATNDGNVVLTNGWVFHSTHIKPVVSLPMFDLAAAVDKQVADFIDDNKGFTAFDVTSALRKTYPSESVPHYQVKEVVHTNMEEVVDYKRELVDVGSPIQPWLYFPEGYDPSSYISGNGAQVLKLVQDDNLTDFGFTTDSSFGQTVAVGNYDNGGVVVSPPAPVSKVRKFLSKFGL